MPNDIVLPFFLMNLVNPVQLIMENLEVSTEE